MHESIIKNKTGKIKESEKKTVIITVTRFELDNISSNWNEIVSKAA